MSRTLASLVLLGAIAHADPAAAPGDGYDLVQAEPSAPLKPGKKAALSLTVLPRDGHRLYADGPVELRLTGEGVKLPRPALRREDAVDARAEAPRFELPLIPERAGPASVAAECTFYLCRGTRCRPVTATARWSLTVTP